MDTIDETGESTTSTTTSTEELNQLIQQTQQESTVEDKRNLDTLAYFKQRIKEEEKRHSKHCSINYWKQDYSKLLPKLKAVQQTMTTG